MNTSTNHSSQNHYRHNIDKAVNELIRLEVVGFYTIPKIAWWVLKYEKLNDYSYAYRHADSCVVGMGCGCAWKSPETKFSDLYSYLENILDLYTNENYFKVELETLIEIRHDSLLLAWLQKNKRFGYEEFFEFWVEWYEEKKELYWKSDFLPKA